MALIDLYNKTKKEHNVDLVFIQAGIWYSTFLETSLFMVENFGWKLKENSNFQQSNHRKLTKKESLQNFYKKRLFGICQKIS